MSQPEKTEGRKKGAGDSRGKETESKALENPPPFLFPLPFHMFGIANDRSGHSLSDSKIWNAIKSKLACLVNES